MSENAISNAKAWLESIQEMLTDLRLAQSGGDGDAEDAVRSTIHEAPLSIAVRSDWYSPGCQHDARPAEYEILLSTGGPALRIHGELDYGEPSTARLQWQDWGTPWTDYFADTVEGIEKQGAGDADVLAFAQCFYFGEG